jgi:outer membrane protein, heavy metal efflux system
MSNRIRTMAVPAVLLVVAGCSSLPRELGYAETISLVEERRSEATSLPRDPTPPVASTSIPEEPLDVELAVRLAFEHNPRVREIYARLGVGRAQLEEARRITNPSIGYMHLDASGGGAQVTRSVSLGIADLLLLPARKRLATDDLARGQASAAADLIELAAEVETAWYRSVGAAQVAAMRDAVSRAAGRSADLAQRFFDAGNINRLQLERELAAAATASIDAARAHADALQARSALAGLLGLPLAAPWQTTEALPAPPPVTSDADTMVRLALDQRLDLRAAHREVALLEDALGVTRRWRWLGSVDVGYEREREVDGIILRGPSIALQLPVFNQGQGAVDRARAELDAARARLDVQALAVSNEATLALERLAVTREISERYRNAVVPHMEAVVAHSQEQVNFMLIGVFELIAAKQDQYDAYQAYLQAVRDYWVARADLRRLVGGRLPDDGGVSQPTIGVETIVPPAASPVSPPHSDENHGMPPQDEAATREHHDHGDTP